jgi:acyl transferase domain-containing protein
VPAANTAALLLVSGRTEAQLKQAASDLAEAVESLSPAQLAHAAYTTQVGRRAHKFRQSVLARTGEEAAKDLRHGGGASAAPAPHAMTIAEKRCRTVGLKQLVEAFPAYGLELRALLEKADVAQRAILESELFGEAAGAELGAAASLLAHVALAAIWKRFGFSPREVVASDSAALAGAVIRGEVELGLALVESGKPGEPNQGASSLLIRDIDGAIALDAAFTSPDNFWVQAGMLWRGRAGDNWKMLNEGRALRRLPLPGYPFERALSRPDLASKPPSAPARDFALPAPSSPQQNAYFADAQKVIETSIRAIWTELLEADNPATEDNFLDLGGDSLAIHRLAVRLREQFEIELPLKDLFETQTIAAQTELVTAILLAKARAMLPDSSVEEAC